MMRVERSQSALPNHFINIHTLLIFTVTCSELLGLSDRFSSVKKRLIC